jgi:hypothetical protein
LATTTESSWVIQLVYRLREQLQVRGQVLRLVIPDQSAAADALSLAGVRAHLEIFQSLSGAGVSDGRKTL